MAATEDKAVGTWLTDKDNIFALAVNPKDKTGEVNPVRYTDGKQTVTGVAFTTDLNKGFLGPFNRRLLQ
ncbi:MAG: hypothetical protein ACYCY3_06850 [Halothiobacillus sp.]